MLNNELVDWIKFTEIIDGIYSSVEYKNKQKLLKTQQKEGINIEEVPIWVSEDKEIKIYDGSDVGKCIRLGKGKSFCISQPGNKNFKSYRDNKTSTFYFIYDDNQKGNPLNIVVFDNTKNGVELTDEKNTTGTIHKYGKDVNAYIDYLKSKNVPVKELLINKPKSDIEIQEDKLLGEKNENLGWFVNLSPEHKSSYIGRGHKLSFEQFKYLHDNNLIDLLNQYLNVGIQLDDKLFNLIKDNENLLKTYTRNQYVALENMRHYFPNNNTIKCFDKFGYLENNKTYLNNRSDSYYKIILNPTVTKLKQNKITLGDASREGYVEAVKILLKAKVNRYDHYPISIATRNGHIEIVKLLIDAGFNKSVGFVDACSAGYVDIVKMLIDVGVDVTAGDNEAIVAASSYGKKEIVKMLIDAGADVRARYNEAIGDASRNGYTEIVEILKKACAVLESYHFKYLEKLTI